MSVIKRASLYLVRKRGRSLLLLIIMLVAAVLAMLGLAVKSGADEELDKLRRSLCSSVILRCNMDDPALSKTEYGKEGQAYSLYTGPPINPALIDKIMDIDHVTDYFVTNKAWYMSVNLQLRPGLYSEDYKAALNDPGYITDIEKTFGMTLDYFKANTQITNFYGCSDTRLQEWFRNGGFDIAEGRHIEAGDKYKAVISTDLARRNGLTVGDTFTAERKGTPGLYRGEDQIGIDRVMAGPVQFEIVGLFGMNFEQEPSYLTNSETGESTIHTMEFMFAENIVFCDAYAAEQINKDIAVFMGQEDRSDWYDEATFFIDDPKNLDAVVAGIKSVDEIRPEYFNIKPDDAAYRVTAKPLGSLSAVSTAMIVVVLAGCVILLVLVLNMWTKTRKHEIGVLLSLGESKRKIVSQQLLESIIIALMALILAAVLSGALANAFGHLTEAVLTPSEITDQPYAVERHYYYFAPVVEKVSADPINLIYGLTAPNILIVALAVLGSTAFSVAVTARNVMKLSPKLILTR
jgi:putative ABC transport system permease protein